MMLDKQRINTILERRLTKTTDPVVHLFPEVLRTKPVQWVTISNDELLLIAFLNPGQLKQIQSRHEQGLDLFPGLMGPRGAGNAAIKLSNTRNIVLIGNRVINMYSFEVGPDSTAVLEDLSLANNPSGHIELMFTTIE